MAAEYSLQVCKELESAIRATGLHRPIRIARYDAGDELVYDVTDVGSASTARVRLLVERFVGGGFAGQVYRVRLIDLVPQISHIIAQK